MAIGVGGSPAALALSASLYVDGWNHTQAFDAYRKLGFERAFDSEVWESAWEHGRTATLI